MIDDRLAPYAAIGLLVFEAEKLRAQKGVRAWRQGALPE